MTDVTIKLQDRVRAAITEQGLSNVQAARFMDISDATLGEWLRERYKGSNENIEAKILAWLNALEKQSLTKSDFAYIDTPLSLAITSVFEFAKLTSDIGVVYGGAGVGKTTTAQRFAKESNNVTHVVMYPAVASQGYCLEEIADNLGVDGVSGAPKLHRAIVRRLIARDSLLIIDEANHLRHDALEAIRSIHDAAQCGVVLMGNESVYSRLTGTSRQSEFAQLFSRLGKRKHIRKLSDTDISTVLDGFKIKGSPEREVLRSIAKKHGALRSMMKTIALAKLLGDLNEKNIRSAWDDLGGVADAVEV